MAIIIHSAETPADISAVRELFREYAVWLGIDLTFQNFRAELASLPDLYAPPAGCLLLATQEDGSFVGCVGVRPLDSARTCEMKRLYLRETARGTGIGYALVTAAVAFAESTGLYSEMLLDTLPRLAAAVSMFQRSGFEPIPSYYANPVFGALFFRKELNLCHRQLT